MRYHYQKPDIYLSMYGELYICKLKELYGEEAHQKIVDAIAAEKAKDVYITSTGLVRNLLFILWTYKS